MNKHASSLFNLTDGVDVYNPPVAQARLAFWLLNNVEPRLGRFFSSRGYSPFQAFTFQPGDYPVSFGFYTLSGQRLTNLYMFTRQRVYILDFVTGLFNNTPIFSGFADNDFPYVIIPWYDALYATKPGGPYVRFERGVATVVANAPFARYGIDANSHAFLANVSTLGGDAFTQTRWSDLDAPEDFVINPNASEADFFDLEPSNNDITGLSYQRGSPIIYSDNSIWIAQYRGFPENFRFDPVFPGLGNIFHYAVVRNKEVDFFIGPDNIYALNGLQPIEIGDGIYERFIADVKIESDTRVRGYVDTRKTQIFWVYKRNDDSLHSIVFNYKENKWSERDPQALSAWFDTPRISFRGYGVIDELVNNIDTYATLINDLNAGTALVLPQLAGAPGAVAKADGRLLKLDDTSFAQVMETHDMFFEDIGEVNEVHKGKIEYVATGSPNITVSIAARKTQSDTLVWSTPVPVNLDVDGTPTFFHRSAGQGKYLRFRFAWTNTATNYITDLRLVSFNRVEKNDADQEK